MFEFECVTSGILRVKFKFVRVKLCVGVVYDTSEDDERRRLEWKGCNLVKEDKTTELGVPSENKNGRIEADF